MAKNTNNRINPCRPGYGASCALCCGSHNFVLNQEQIEDLLRQRAETQPMRPLHHPEEALLEKMFPDAMQCPNMGVLPGEEGLVGCLIYHEQNRGPGIESFITGTCRNFYCPAWDELSDRQILFAARLMGDWYWYSLLINHLEALMDLCSAYDSPEDVTPEELDRLKEELLERLNDEDGK